MFIIQSRSAPVCDLAITPSFWRASKLIISAVGLTSAILLAKLRTITNVMQLDVFSSLFELTTFYVPSENFTKLPKNCELYKFCYSLYGSVTSDVLNPEIYRICAAWRIALRQHLPYNAHCDICCKQFH